MQFEYVNITTNGCDGWINLFFGDHCIALIDNKFIADSIKQSIKERMSDNSEKEFNPITDPYCIVDDDIPF